MNVQRAVCAAALAVSFSASAADLFFVVGQTNTTWRGASVAATVHGDVKLLSWTAASTFTSFAGLSGKDDSPVGPLDGVVPAFANTWFSLSKSPAHFAIYRKPEAALTPLGADGKPSWTDYTASVYQDALRSFKDAQQSAATASPEGIQHRYLIWIQNEVDAPPGVSAKDYQAKLGELFEHFNRDLGADGKPFDAMFIVSSGLMRDGGASVINQKRRKAEPGFFDAVNAIVQAQDSAAAEGKIVMISRSMRSPLGACAQGQGSPECATKDLLQYHAWLYENLGAEMARNAYTYQSKGIKALLPTNCKQDPASCAGTVDVYRWVAKADATSAKVYGTDPYELDDATYRFTGTRFALFQDNAPGRIPLYRSTEAGKPGLSTELASAKTKPLGYCYAVPTGNALAKLVAVEQDGMTGVLRYPGDPGETTSLDPQHEKTLCYVS